MKKKWFIGNTNNSYANDNHLFQFELVRVYISCWQWQNAHCSFTQSEAEMNGSMDGVTSVNTMQTIYTP